MGAPAYVCVYLGVNMGAHVCMCMYFHGGQKSISIVISQVSSTVYSVIALFYSFVYSSLSLACNSLIQLGWLPGGPRAPGPSLLVNSLLDQKGPCF